MSAAKPVLFRRFDRHDLLLGVVLLLALAVRVYGIGFPLYHWDERTAFTDVFFAIGNNLQMSTFEHGSLLTLVLLMAWSPIVAVAQKAFPGTFEFFLAYYQNPLLLAVPGRLVSSLAGVGSVVCVYYLGKRMYDRTTGLIASFFLALAFLDVTESHYMQRYELTSLFSTLSVYFCIRILSEPRLRNYVLAGLFIGLAAAAQYTVVLLVVPLVTSHIVVTQRKWGAEAWRHLFSKTLIAGLDTAGLAFFLVTPDALIEFQAFAGFMKWFVTSRAGVTWVSSEGQPVWLFYLKEHLAGGIGIELEIVALLGLALALYRHRAQDLVLVEFPFLLMLTLNGGPNFARYAVPLLPFVMVMAANLLSQVSLWSLRWVTPQVSSLALVVATAGLVIPSFLNIVRFDYMITQPDTRLLAAQWIQANVPAGTKIATEGLDILGPSIPPDRSMIDAANANARTKFEKEEMRALEITTEGQPGYRVNKLFRLDQDVRGGIQVGEIPSVQTYADSGVDYLVTVNWMQRSGSDEYSAAFHRSLDEMYQPIVRFGPTIIFRYDPYAWRVDYDALARIDVGHPQVGGPLLTVYRRVGTQP